jgi:anti-anti-sigma factor
MTVEFDTGTPPNRVELTSPSAEVAVVALIGEHDLGRYETLAAVLARAAVRAPNVIVDLTHCAFIDSTTISLLLNTHAFVTGAGGGLCVVIAPEPGAVSRLAELVRLDSMIAVHASLDAAMESLDST